ncbi:hypothetical protein ACGFRB_19580 [Streptomyces sp. NPDC048718]|uniref:hypothetical protein n=1 Tax=Streptomyces sp. NPDC048718 TaxID=3365587 RepID=UPI0037157F6A
MRNAIRTALSITALAMLASACGESNLAAPKELCGVPLEESSTSPLIPQGEILKTWAPYPVDADPADCAIKVDGSVIVDITVRFTDKDPAPEDWEYAKSEYKLGALRKTPFAGTAVIGTDGALISAKCDSPTKYLQFVTYFDGDRVDNSQAGVEKLQNFIEDFVTGAKKKIGCTA